MPKIRRQRTSLHSTAVPLSGRTFAAPDLAVEALGALPLPTEAAKLDPNALLQNISAPLPSLVSAAPVEPAASASPAKEHAPTRSRPIIRKREKKAQRRQEFMKKLHHAYSTMKENKEKKPAGPSKPKTALQRGFGELRDSLAAITSVGPEPVASGERPAPARPAKSKAAAKARGRQDLLAQESKRFQQALQLTASNSDPLAAIKQHLRTTQGGSLPPQ
ncbi:hypothetical protein IWQ60_008187 [Tieghemiomyces parasiticus]|uniref:Ribosome biogenesis protein SLX9 n=1 Tax=Tieghemiomyces parasiticus TaxID=78921 RepID=A0A9W8DSN8_9FUNG|nr:hypothetical protein IWQ60_008187 [Tieghemiomyces parasiticus]